MARIAHEVFLEAYEIFCIHYHSKPYTLFNPELFRRKIDRGQVPRYLQFAFIATAVRFSSQVQWKSRKQKTIDEYAHCAWKMIMSEPDGLGDGSDVSVVQTLALLAVIDATAGRRRAAWVKIGMAVRISQDLHMMLEPDVSLPAAEREERRNLFWSLFLLDRFVCCSFKRPPAIQVRDCQLRLHVDHPLQDNEVPLTLGELLTKKSREMPNRVVGLSGLSVGFVALLGRAIECMMNLEAKASEPWRPESDHTEISDSLEALKDMVDTYLPGIGISNKEGSIRLPQTDRTSHFVLSLTLYNLAHCILSHPFLLGMTRKSCPFTPSAWFDAQFASCWSHAQALTSLVVDAKAAGYILAPSFYSYCILVAGTVHAILLHCDDEPASVRAAQYLKTSRDYLSDVSEMWQNAYIMSDALRFFTNRCVRYSGILLGPTERINELTGTDVTVLRSVLDYWTMMDPANPVSQLNSVNMDCFARSPNGRDEVASMGPSDTETTIASNSAGDRSLTVDPEKLINLSFSVASPLRSDGMVEFSTWNWDSELI
ncbi:fungal-specific transcription factor domain-containing protein [Aspergillus venezuelensis]